MNRYLTEKGARSSWWELPLAGFGLLMGAAGVSAFVEDFFAKPGFVSLAAWVLVMALVLSPIYVVVRRLLLRHRAKCIARRLDPKIVESIPLSDLDRIAGEKDAAELIRRLIAKGFLQNLMVDDGNGCLWLARSAVMEKAAVPEIHAVEDASYNEILQKIRMLNADIADRPVSQRIDRLEAVTTSVFRTLVAKPDKAKDARRFLNYYLPTIFKLLETYNLLEDQSYQGDTIRASRQQIEGILEKLVGAVEQLQDKLFSAEALDVEAEIRVMETMMAADGLTSDGSLRALRQQR